MKTIRTDFLIIGSGLAGLTYAMNVCKHGRTALVCKSELAFTNTFHAQGGIASVLSEKDNFESHIQDTLTAGDGCCNEKAVRFMASKAPVVIEELIAAGVEFSKNCDQIELGLEGGHSHHRIIHAKDETGREVQIKLLTKLKNEDVEIFEHHFVFELIVKDKVCYGAYAFDLKTNETVAFISKAIFLATGGLGQAFLHTTNPSIATGDGVAMAFEAGALISDMEFIQFHPTCLYDPRNKPFLISEALRGFGAELKTRSGRAFMKEYHPSGSLAPRDIVSRAIVFELERTGESCVYLDLTGTDLDKAHQCFPNIFKTCFDRGIDPFKEMIPVVPAAHYACGGVVTDLNGKTSLEGLYAAGEVACTGVHGANRLASNSLLEAAVFGKSAAGNSVVFAKNYSKQYLKISNKRLGLSFDNKERLEDIKKQTQQLMWEHSGIKRTKKGLTFCLSELIEFERELKTHFRPSTFQREFFELKNILTTSRLIVSAALLREKSKGGHFIDVES